MEAIRLSNPLSLKESDPNADTSALEFEIDRLVYNLYDLTNEKNEKYELWRGLNDLIEFF